MNSCEIINFPKILDNRGNLSFLENNSQIPFEIKRVYWIYDVPGGEYRGNFAFKKNKEIIIALSGGFDIELNFGEYNKVFSLTRSYMGLFIPNLTWRKIINFTTNSLGLIISSEAFDLNDYIRDYKEYLEMINAK